MKIFSLLINTCLLVGKSSIVPGTLGSVFALLIWFLFSPSLITMLIVLVIVTSLSYYTILFELHNSNEKDPQYIVIDEAIGMWISLLFISSSNFINICLAFIIFRLFDILKPSIINRSQNIQGPVLVEFVVEQHDMVYPMVPAGADLDEMINRPVHEQFKDSEM